MRNRKVLLGTLLGVCVTPPAVSLAIISAGAGHGHYEFARLLYPYSMLLTRLAGDIITPLLMVLALLQFPLYGAAMGFAATKGQTAWAVVLLGAVHAAAAVLCFSGTLPNFS